MKYARIVPGRFLDRPNRFIAHVLAEGREQTVHVKNTGRCRELLVPGARVYLSDEEGRPGRKTRYDLVAVEKGSLLINMDSQAPNEAAAEWLEETGFLGRPFRREYRWGSSRFDFAGPGPEPALLEVKWVTLEQDGLALFPDAPTLRGRRHLQELAAYPGRAALLFVIQMRPVRAFAPNGNTDPGFALALRQAVAAGVEVLAMDCVVSPEGMTLFQPVALRL